MPQIELLDQTTIDKIAAGEVVESPANVAKELVENAIDSGATAVTVEIREGGIGFIRVTDNGCGIPAEEIRKAFLRHATSKLRTIADLYSIHSLGFRGEALSSIAAVSRVEMITRTRDAVTGVRYEIEGAKEKTLEEIGAPYGTTIIMRQLFFNTPARAKFLKSASAESNKVTAFVEQLALSRPDIAFKYIVNGSVKLVTTGTGNMKETAFQIYGKEIIRSMIPVDSRKEFTHITGFIGTPEIARGNKGFENYFVNGRYVKSKLISSAIEDGYAGNLMQHRFPFVILFLEIDREKVDVNVHPAKLELRFSRQEEIYEEIRRTVNETIESRRVMPELTLDKEKKPAPAYTPVTETPKMAESAPVYGKPAEEKHENTEKEEKQKAPEPFEEQRRARQKEASNISAENYRRPVPELVAERQLSLFDEEEVKKQQKKNYRIIGQLFETYILVEMEDNLYIIDQHAAHEKVMYEQFMKDLAGRKIHTQQLLPAVALQLSLKEAELLAENLDSFTALGFELEPFGGRSWRITGIPVNLFKVDVKALFTELLDGEEFRKNPQVLAERVASASCKAAVKGNMRLSDLEIKALMEELFSLEDPYHCPHGRPVYVQMAKTELDRKIGRIV